MKIEYKPKECESENLVYCFEEKDPQAIPWNTDMFQTDRQSLRMSRFHNYSSYRNLSVPLRLKESTVFDNCDFFSFQQNHPIKCEYSHFQLRDNIKVRSASDIFVKTKTNSISKFNSINQALTFVYQPQFPAVSFDVLDDFIVLGGNDGELCLVDPEGTVKFSTILSNEDSKITNSVKFFKEGGSKKLLVCNNDRKIRIMDFESCTNLEEYAMEACVNHATLSPDQNLIAACLDKEFDYILDRKSGKEVAKCVGHTDYGFSVDWDPTNHFQLATGNQDMSIMIWDLRDCSKPVHVLRCYLGAALNIKYSENGKYLAFTESADFFNVIDKKNIAERQYFDFFGEISGFGFLEEDRENLRVFLGMADPTYCSLIELYENSQTSLMI